MWRTSMFFHLLSNKENLAGKMQNKYIGCFIAAILVTHLTTKHMTLVTVSWTESVWIVDAMYV